MDSASFQFVLFGLAVAMVSNFNETRVWRSMVLLIGSLIFLWLLAPNPLAFLPLAGFLALGFAALLLLQRGVSRSLVWSLSAVILVYLWLKKYTFLPEASFLRFPYFTLGLSYIFFRVLHLLIEANPEERSSRIGLGPYLMYTLNFTTLVSGPIQRYDAFAEDQFAIAPMPLTVGVVSLQVERILRGLVKVNVLAMLLDMVRADALVQLSQPLPTAVKLYAAFRIAVVYPFFLYANFSGYIDVVIGLGRLMRVRLPENFDRPFSASSFLDFWNRWHITLSTWLKTYVYNPLLVALMRRIESPEAQPFLGVFAFFVTFFLIGIWHGRTSEFALFGVLQGGGVAINKLWQVWLGKRLGRKGYKALAARPVYIAFGRGLTFSWFAFTLFWFWATWRQIDLIFKSIGLLGWLAIWLSVWLLATLVLEGWERLRGALMAVRTEDGPVLTSRYARMVYASALGLTAFVVMALLSQPAPDIVYKAF
jgi:D-alanyl-lipoteichoic acid acyltransferase DltB (MBOAT superfamily)